jgi:uncharacterized protein (DUF4415 family)
VSGVGWLDSGAACVVWTQCGSARRISTGHRHEREAKRLLRTSTSKDYAPEITESWIAEADLRRGQKIVRRGRPKLDKAKRLLSLRLRPEVIATWRASVPGWQTQWPKC